MTWGPPQEPPTVRLPTPQRDGGPVEAVWGRVPRMVAVVSPTLATALADAPPLRRQPAAMLLAPALALLVGLTVGATHVGGSDVWTSSIVVVLVFVVLATTLGGGVGTWITLGYAVGDLVLGTRPSVYPDGALETVGAFGGLLICYAATFILLGQVPVLATLLGERVAGRTGSTVLEASARGVVAAAFAWSWSQAVPLFLRPMFVWAGGEPPYYAVVPVQTAGLLIAGVAGVGSLARCLLDRTGPGPTPRPPWPPSLVDRLGTVPGRFTRAVLSTVAVGALFSGLVGTPLDAAILLGFAAGAALLRCVLLPEASGVVRFLVRIPLVVRIAAAVGSGIGAGYVLLQPVYAGTGDALSFRPLLVGIGVGMVVAAVLMPEGSLAGRAP